MITLLKKLNKKMNIFPTKNPERENRMIQWKQERHPQAMKLSNTVTPNGVSLNEWMNGTTAYYWN